MSGKRLVLFCVAIVAMLVALEPLANAALIITTNKGDGADAEVRESQTEIDFGGVPLGQNRGSNTELATRAKDDGVATNDRSSIMYLKFDISNLSAGDLTGKEVALRLHVRNNNLPQSRLYAVKNLDPEPVFPEHNVHRQHMQFVVKALDPAGTYVEDDAGAADRTDRSGNNYSNSEYKYNWDESAITWYNAPGIQPHCMLQGSCADAGTGSGDAANDVTQTLGLYDDFNSDVLTLGTWQWPNVPPQNHLAVGSKLTFQSQALTDLVVDTLTNHPERDHIVLMVHHNLDASVSGETPNSFKNFNYLAIPKEMTTLNLDNNYDPDVNSDNFPDDPLGDPIGSPHSCSFDATNRPQCTGAGDNTGGSPVATYSPKLIIWVPEPSSFALLVLGSLASLALVRRGRK